MFSETATVAMTIVQTSVQHLFPTLSLEQAFAELLLERARKNLIHYRAAAQRLGLKHQQAFVEFQKQIISDTPTFETEQDYFDWEMAVTGIADMEKEIQQLQTLVPRL